MRTEKQMREFRAEAEMQFLMNDAGVPAWGATFVGNRVFDVPCWDSGFEVWHNGFCALPL